MMVVQDGARSMHHLSGDAGERAAGPRYDLAWSLLFGAALVGFALVGLAVQGNWPKIVRVGTAAGAYLATLVLCSRLGRPDETADTLPYWWFGAAGVLAGALSGMLHPGRSVTLVITSAMLTAALLGGLHWLALRTWRRLRAAQIVE